MFEGRPRAVRVHEVVCAPDLDRVDLEVEQVVLEDGQDRVLERRLEVHAAVGKVPAEWIHASQRGERARVPVGSAPCSLVPNAMPTSRRR